MADKKRFLTVHKFCTKLLFIGVVKPVDYEESIYKYKHIYMHKYNTYLYVEVYLDM